ncbi:MAG: hypothetical protein Q8P67_17160, partial [archaeon]|nr:hypothetical protein [archaeon]
VDVNERVTSILLDFPEVVLAADGTVAALSSSLKGSLLSSSPSFLFAAPRQLQHHEAADSEGLDESDDDFVEADDETDDEETAAGDASNWTPIFSFDFQSFPANIHYSSGAYGATGNAHYQLLITDPKGFILNIIQQDASGKITYVQPQKSWFLTKLILFFSPLCAFKTKATSM